MTVLQFGPAFPADTVTKMPAACVFSTICAQGVVRAPLARRAAPAVVHHVRPERRIRVTTREVRRRHEELEALGIGRRRSVPLIHVPAADPLRSRSDADLVRARTAVVTRGRARRVRSVRVVVAGRLRVRPADPAARVNRVPPVVVVVRVRPVPASVVRLEGVVRPADTRVLVCDHDPGAVEPERPDLWSLDLVDARFDDFRCGRRDRRDGVEGVLGNCRLVRFEPVRRTVRLDHLHVGPGGKGVDQSAVTLGDDHVRRPERLVRDALRLEQRAKRRLCPVRRLLERPVDVPPLSVLVPHAVGGTEVRLLREMDDDRGSRPPAVSREHPILDLARVAGDRLRGLTTTARQNWCYSRDQPCERERNRDSGSSTHSSSPSPGS